ncbi:MAG: ROK family protein [Desulfatibacillaceae bacterium]
MSTNTGKTVLGIDIGGTYTKFGLVDPAGRPLFVSHMPTRADRPAEDLFGRLAEAYREHVRPLDTALEVSGAGIGAPNVNANTGIIVSAPNLSWRDTDIPALSETYLGLFARADNDANAWALGEMLYGAARGMRDFVLVTLGTGLGSGIVVDGRVVRGHTGYASELGHVTVVPGGRRCGCGRRGCLETYASATGLVRTVLELLAEKGVRGSLAGTPPSALDAKQVADAARDGDEVARTALERTAAILGRALADTTCHTSPRAFVLAGGLAGAGDLILEPVRRHLEENHFPAFANTVEVLASGLPEDTAGVLGAAALWREG